MGCHFLLQCMKVKSESEVAQLCPTLGNPMDCSLPGSSVHGIFQASVLEWGDYSHEIKRHLHLGRKVMTIILYLLRNIFPMDGGAWWAAVCGVAKSQTRLSDFTLTFPFMHWRRKWQPTPVFLPGKSQGQGSLAGCCLWGHRGLDTTKAT